jgi:hypothetical protein
MSERKINYARQRFLALRRRTRVIHSVEFGIWLLTAFGSINLSASPTAGEAEFTAGPSGGVVCPPEARSASGGQIEP